jgi:lipopolysaccharide transport system ATP-binding protein
MYVRLAFAVAAHLESEILIVDEVLAVGDAEFQKKCLGKMNDVAKGEGRTVLFVSHNMAAVKSLCNKGILLENGSVTYKNNAENVIDYYLSNANNLSYESLSNRRDRKGNGLIKVKEIRLLNKNAEYVNQVISGETLTIRFFLEKNKDFKNYDKLFFGVNIINNEEVVLTSYLSDEMGTDTSKYSEKDFIDLKIPNFNFRGGTYSINFQLGNGSTSEKDFLDYLQNAYKFEVLPGDFWKTSNINRSGDNFLLEGLFI